MKTSLKKSLLILGCLSSLALSADFTPPHGACNLPADYEQPVVQDTKAAAQPSKLKQAGILTASAAVNVAALAAMIVANACIEGALWGTFYDLRKAYPKYRTELNICSRTLIPFLSTFGMVELSTYLIEKMGLKTNKLALGILMGSQVRL